MNNKNLIKQANKTKNKYTEILKHNNTLSSIEKLYNRQPLLDHVHFQLQKNVHKLAMQVHKLYLML